jgi:cyclopropane-fatty-acyl-phospholipid synthase
MGAASLPVGLRRALERRLETLAAGVPFALRLPDREPLRFGPGEPRFVLAAESRTGAAALASLDRTRLAEAYLEGHLHVEGDLQALLSLRDRLRERNPGILAWRFLRPLFFGQVASDKAWIARHYDEDPEFYLRFLDRRHRCYSQAVFERDDESLEAAMTRKLDYTLGAVGARPGDRILDVGGGWGAFTEHAGRKGVRVTSLTISTASETFLRSLIERESLPCDVRREHLMEHRPDRPYDGIVNLGVTEHLPDYPATLARYRELLKPGGRVVLDASAARVKHDLSSFFLRHVFPGNGSPLCLHDYLAAVAASPFELVEVHNDRENYLRTARHWAENLDRHRDEIVLRWGLAHYRTFQLYLWGCVDGFSRDVIQAYRWVLHLRPG